MAQLVSRLLVIITSVFVLHLSKELYAQKQSNAIPTLVLIPEPATRMGLDITALVDWDTPEATVKVMCVTPTLACMVVTAGYLLDIPSVFVLLCLKEISVKFLIHVIPDRV